MSFNVDEAIKKAMKEKNASALAAYRSLKTKILNKLTEAGRGQDKPLSDEELVALVKREVKERQEANEFLDASRPEHQENRQIIAVLETLLPAQMSAEAMEAAIRKVIADTGAAGPQDLGKVMGALKKVPGLDMGAASARVKALLTGG